MKIRMYLKYIVTIATIVFLNTSNKIYAQNVDDLYKKIGDIFKNACSGFDAYIFTHNKVLAKSVGLRTKRKFILKNGQLDCRLLYYPMQDGKFS